ncbi:hypothetical protein [Halopiger aswanensis]|uniref:Uncharacterized protein n=1 Tax=Halopiger aswanensis TaxID=148449 RepID=A0A419WDB7_9EURY|nr:hypothetical protein [Halopiger aswanensis]RKD93392.1 hypothetical protein ATJ93_3016 [Halopiger aswanensis]
MTTLTIAMTTAITLLKVLRTLGIGTETRNQRHLTQRFRGSLRERFRTLVPVVLALAVIGIGTIVYAELVFVLLEYAE